MDAANARASRPFPAPHHQPERRLDGEAVTARSYVDAIVLGPDNVRGVQAAGWYDDVVVQTDDGWKIARRRFTPVRMQVIEPG